MGDHTVNINRKEMRRITPIYGLIVIAVNVVGVMMANASGLPVSDSEDYKIWLQFLDGYSIVYTISSIMSFVIPTLCIVRYSREMIKKKPERIINVPFMYATLGCLGWVISFVMEYICLLYVKIRYGISIWEIGTASFLNIMQESICIFTLAFLSMNFVHRKWVLPKLFPEGKLDRFSTGLKPSVRFLVIVFYLSICIFPVFFLTSSLITILRNNSIPMNLTVFITLGFILVISGIILWTFCDYFTAPLKKLKLGISKIKAGDYQYQIDIVSNDDFGELADAFNDMSNALDEKNKRIHAIQNSIIKGMAVMVEWC